MAWLKKSKRFTTLQYFSLFKIKWHDGDTKKGVHRKGQSHAWPVQHSRLSWRNGTRHINEKKKKLLFCKVIAIEMKDILCFSTDHISIRKKELFMSPKAKSAVGILRGFFPEAPSMEWNYNSLGRETIRSRI